MNKVTFSDTVRCIDSNTTINIASTILLSGHSFWSWSNRIRDTLFIESHQRYIVYNSLMIFFSHIFLQAQFYFVIIVPGHDRIVSFFFFSHIFLQAQFYFLIIVSGHDRIVSFFFLFSYFLQAQFYFLIIVSDHDRIVSEIYC